MLKYIKMGNPSVYLIKRGNFECKKCRNKFFYDRTNSDETIVFATDENETALAGLFGENGYYNVCRKINLNNNEFEEKLYPFLRLSPQNLQYRIRRGKPVCPQCGSEDLIGLSENYLSTPEYDWIYFSNKIFKQYKVEK